MNYARIAAAAVAATVVDGIYGFLVYGMLLANEFANFPQVYRSNEAGMTYLPGLFACVFVGALVAAYIYAKGYEGGSGVTEGVRYGVLLGILISAVFAGVNYATLNIGRRLSAEMAVAGFFEWMLVGIVIGLVYRPSPAGAK